MKTRRSSSPRAKCTPTAQSSATSSSRRCCASGRDRLQRADLREAISARIAWSAARGPALLAELAGVLERPKFRRWLPVEEARAFVQMLRVSATVLNDPPQRHHDLRDPDDSYLVTLARSAKADYLVSGDGDLTILERPRPPVITPADFLASLDTNE